MYTLRILCVSILCILVNYNAVARSLRKPRLINGNVVSSIEKFGYQASVRYLGQHICGGSIIDNRHILTAASCLFQRASRSIIPSSALSIVVGDLEIYHEENNTVIKNVAHVFSHNRFNYNNGANDIALIRIKETFGEWTNEIHSVNLTHPKLTDNPEDCVVSGWGEQKLDSYVLSTNLQYAIVKIVETIQCYEEDDDNLNKELICAKANNVTSTEGDTGGPLVCSEELTGVSTLLPNLYTNVGNYYDWIQLQIAKSSSQRLLNCVSVLLLCVFNLFIVL